MNEISKRTITATLLALFFAIFYLLFPPYVFSTLIAIIIAYAIFVEWPRFFPLQSIAFWLTAGGYLLFPAVLLIILNQDATYRILLPFMVLLVAAHDTGSYLAGITCGKHLIAPTISPKKTWEGFAGGIVLTALIYGGWVYFWHLTINWFAACALILSVCTVALCGDMAESWLKRRACIKDSGALLPGHGGILDRADALLPVAVMFFFWQHTIITLCQP